MEIASSFAGDFSFLQFLVALVVSGLCLVCALFAVRFSPASFGRKSRSVESDGGGSGGSLRKACSCACLCRSAESGPATATAAAAAYLNGGAEEMLDRALVVSERQTGASMMEQLVPEITTHALSYLDYPSLCRLSMTNSLMRKAANDDNAWKALYHKDFTLEQDSVTPTNGWKAYYAATRAIVNINAEFFNIIRERSITSMSRLWFNADYVKCVHASGELFTGYNAVIESWQLAFNWDQGVDFQGHSRRKNTHGPLLQHLRKFQSIGYSIFVENDIFVELHLSNGQMVWSPETRAGMITTTTTIVAIPPTHSAANPWWRGPSSTIIRFPPSKLRPLSSSPSSSVSVVEEGEEEAPPLPSDAAAPLQSQDPPLGGCKACGREEMEKGCNGEGRIQGGIGTVPGFGWWPIKAYRPCPGFVASGGRYRRRGQSMDEVAFGRGGKGASMASDEDVQSRQKKKRPKEI